jgi:hypothetical protein
MEHIASSWMLWLVLNLRAVAGASLSYVSQLGETGMEPLCTQLARLLPPG